MSDAAGSSSQPSATTGSGDGAASSSSSSQVPRETLIALIKKKDKELKTVEAKLDKIEDRYVKLLRFNKILHEDRASFLRFCKLLLPDPETAFEEAAAQETPINFELLTPGIESLEGKDRELNVLRDFVRLVFPNEAEQMLSDQTATLEAQLRAKWIMLEELQNRSLQEANIVAQQNMQNTNQNVKAMESQNRSLKAENKDLQLQIQNLRAQNNNRAQQLTSKMQSGGAGSSSSGGATDQGAAPGVVASGVDQGRVRDLEQRIQQLQQENLALTSKCDQIDGSYRAELELGQRMLQSVKSQHAEEKRQYTEQLSTKEKQMSKMEHDIAKMEEELDTSRMITKAAELQANRDLILREQGEETRKLRFQVREMEQKMRKNNDEQVGMKKRIRELEIMSDANVDKAYLREVVYKYCEYAQKGDMKAQSLIPAVCTVIGCSNVERESLMKAALPTPWLVLNQAIGTWAAAGTGDEGAPASSSSSTGPRKRAAGPKRMSQPPTPAGKQAAAKASRSSAGSGNFVPPDRGGSDRGKLPPAMATSRNDGASTTASQASDITVESRSTSKGQSAVNNSPSKTLIKTSERRPEIRKPPTPVERTNGPLLQTT
ncbi:unnamed protein product [Amoebophrya sp. A120]|nr:unnamed protein product [Amoebophrya sp. A120]|eukprot:GSA120T00002187001.1